MSKKYIIRPLTDKKARTRAAKVLGLYAEKLGRFNCSIEVGDPDRWHVIYEHNEKRSGIVVLTHPNGRTTIEYAAVENEGQGELKALIRAGERQFNGLHGVCIDMDRPDVWRHLGYTFDGLLNFSPHLFNIPFEAFAQGFDEDATTQGNDLLAFLELMQTRKDLAHTRTIIKPLL